MREIRAVASGVALASGRSAGRTRTHPGNAGYGIGRVDRQPRRQRGARPQALRPQRGPHRATVPCPPELTALLHDHLTTCGTAVDGRLFWGVRDGGRISSTVYGRAWASARTTVFTPGVLSTSLARRPYDLRHAAVSAARDRVASALRDESSRVVPMAGVVAGPEVIETPPKIRDVFGTVRRIGPYTAVAGRTTQGRPRDLNMLVTGAIPWCGG